MFLHFCATSVIFAFAFAAERGTPCVTPYGERVTCVSVLSCPGILNSLLIKNASATEFIRRSQCGYDVEPLVCCRFSDYSPEIFDVFTQPTERTPEEEPCTTTCTPVIEAPIHFSPNVLPNTTECGLQKATDRILPGSIADFVEFTWLAALEYKNKLTGKNAGIRCAGSIISNRFILTAARCIIDSEFELTSVWLGDWKLSTDPDCEELVANIECTDRVLKMKIDGTTPHPFYSRKTGNNDIGLLRLKNAIKYSDYISPICLPPYQLPSLKLGAHLRAAGWGATRNGISSDIKLKKTLQVVLSNKCRKEYPHQLINANQMCVTIEQEKPFYVGDSGGPLMRAYSNQGFERDRWYQEGVGSWGVGNTQSGPIVYTRVTRYIQWIVNNMQ